jgi:protein-tyrosine phosphatase
MSDTQTSVLFICMGNICRSPAAECFFINAIEKLGHDMDFIVDSAGTGGWHAGAKPDKRMRAAAKKQGFVISGSARQVTTEDFSAFDWIFCMDQHNLDDVLAMGANPKKTKMLLPYVGHESMCEVPDPYYGGEDGFDDVVTLIHDAASQLALKLCP